METGAIVVGTAPYSTTVAGAYSSQAIKQGIETGTIGHGSVNWAVHWDAVAIGVAGMTVGSVILAWLILRIGPAVKRTFQGAAHDLNRGRNSP